MAVGHQLLLCCVFSSLLLPASCSMVHQKHSQSSPLPVRTHVVDSPLELQQGVAASAVYQDIAPSVRRHQHRCPPSVQLCEFDTLGRRSWPPTAVCWVPPVFPQLVPANSVAAFEGKAHSAERSEVGPLVGISESLDELPGPKGPLEYTQIDNLPSLRTCFDVIDSLLMPLPSFCPHSLHGGNNALHQSAIKQQDAASFLFTPCLPLSTAALYLVMHGYVHPLTLMCNSRFP